MAKPEDRHLRSPASDYGPSGRDPWSHPSRTRRAEAVRADFEGHAPVPGVVGALVNGGVGDPNSRGAALALL
jgi:hypothetical protein